MEHLPGLLPLVSIVIPHYNSQQSLVRCLGCLERQSLDRGAFEVIVVDNNSARFPGELANPYGMNLKIVSETKKGSYAARNAGVSLAKGTTIAFTDADCEPNVDWLELALREMEESQVSILAGEILLEYSGSTPKAIEMFDSVFFGLNQRNAVKEIGYGITANLFVRKFVFAQVGLFNATLYSGGDVEWGRRAYFHGFTIRFGQSAKVVHPARRTFHSMISKVRRVVGGQVQLERKGFLVSIGRGRTLLQLLKPPVRTWLRFYRQRDNKRGFRLGVLVLFFRYVQLFERVRLLFGGNRVRI